VKGLWRLWFWKERSIWKYSFPEKCIWGLLNWIPFTLPPFRFPFSLKYKKQNIECPPPTTKVTVLTKKLYMQIIHNLNSKKCCDVKQKPESFHYLLIVTNFHWSVFQCFCMCSCWYLFLHKYIQYSIAYLSDTLPTTYYHYQQIPPISKIYYNFILLSNSGMFHYLEVTDLYLVRLPLLDIYFYFP
jgi:hypothetical protein